MTRESNAWQKVRYQFLYGRLILIPYIVLVVYSKGGGKYGAYGFMESAQDINIVAFVSAQLYVHSGTPFFLKVHPKSSIPHAVQFRHLKTFSILHRLADSSIPTRSMSGMRLSTEAYAKFCIIERNLPGILKAVGELQKRTNISEKSGTAPREEVVNEDQ
jgi:hypothetical protein